MQDFAKTPRGQKYFDVDLPKLTNVLEKIAIGIDKQNKLEEQRQIFEKEKLLWEKKMFLHENNKPSFTSDPADK